MASKTKDFLVQLMAERGLSQSDIARALSVRPQAVQQWVSGKTRPTGKNLEALAEYLQLLQLLSCMGLQPTDSLLPPLI